MEQEPSTVKQAIAFRVRPRTLERLRRRAQETGQTQTALAERYIDEGVRSDEHPLVYFRDGAAGRRPAVIGSRLDVWQVIETLRASEGSVDATAAYLELPLAKVQACLRYYADFPDEIDDWIERTRSIAAREEERWRREQTLLG
jgi:uncharacterized protein (DUF433 family)